MAARSHPRQGDVYWAWVAPLRGKAKRRPVVVVTPTDAILLGREIVCVALTSSPVDPNAAELVQLSWHARGLAPTGLRKPTWAVCNWLVPITESELESRIGFVPERILREILGHIDVD